MDPAISVKVNQVKNSRVSGTPDCVKRRLFFA